MEQAVERFDMMVFRDDAEMVPHVDGDYVRYSDYAALAETLRGERIEMADQLERWANESRNGGWSTHQVDPMRRLADKLRISVTRNCHQSK
jgi:hypothetical protein